MFRLSLSLLSLLLFAAVPLFCKEDDDSQLPPTITLIEQYQRPATRNHLEIIQFTFQCRDDTPPAQACCAIYAAQGDEDLNLLEDASVASFPIESPGRIVVASLSSENWNVGVASIEERCTIEQEPTINDSTPIDEILVENVPARGQLDRYELDMIKIGSTYFLYDFSRNQAFQDLSSNEGGIANGERISAWAFSFYDSRSGLGYSQHLFTEDPLAPSPLIEEGLDALRGSQQVYDFLWQLGINSHDNLGSSMISWVYFDSPPEPTNLCGQLYPAGSFNNAFESGGSVFFTKNVSRNIASYSADLDIVAHEWGHALLDSYIRLKYERESGAMSEAFSDWMAAAVDWHYGDREGQWLIGEKVETFRNMMQPNSSPDVSQPDFYRAPPYWWPVDERDCQIQPARCCQVADVCNDYCGVHFNSGVPNLMFYLLSEGTTEPFPGNITVNGIGIEKAFKIARHAAQNYWLNDELSFPQARAGMIAAAIDLAEVPNSGIAPEAKDAVEAAWAAVGVGLPSPSSP